MAITGAIFDCDGTLMDSMPMWREVTLGLLAQNGVADPERVFEETEVVPLDAMCELLHARYGVQKTGGQLLEEFGQMAREGYRSKVSLIDGCLDLLRQLRAAGIPLCVASCTTLRELTFALEAWGIRDYFDHIVDVSTIARGKEHPDIYLAALELLGTPLESTWVFEDSPTGLGSAREAGFPCACVYNEHDGRDRELCRRLSDIFSHGYIDLSLPILQDFERPRAQGHGVLRALVVAGSPAPSSPGLVARLASEADYVVAADRGIDTLRAAGVAPQVFCGDSDSASPEGASWGHEASLVNLDFPSEKYATDLALALESARHEAARQEKRLELCLSCASGGRPDHALGVIGQLLRLSEASPRMVEDDFECRVLSPGGAEAWDLGPRARGCTLSVVALLPQSVCSETGVRWELSHRELPLLGDEGISNVVTSDDARVSCHEGALAVFLMGGDGSTRT